MLTRWAQQAHLAPVVGALGAAGRWVCLGARGGFTGGGGQIGQRQCWRPVAGDWPKGQCLDGKGDFESLLIVVAVCGR